MIQLTKRLFSRAAMTLLVMMLTNTTAWAGNVTVTSSTTNWTSGNTYAVNSNVTINDHVTVTGSVTLSIASGCTLNVNSGITVNDGGMLTVTGSGGTLNVIGSNGEDIYDAAGHDTGDPTDGSAAIDGNLTVNSGTVTITGGKGGDDDIGNKAADGGDGIHGNLTVNGGTVTVTGGIGGQAFNCNSNGGYGVSDLLTVNDGNVTVYGGASGSGYIGGTPGYGVSRVTVNGGFVQITGGVDSYSQNYYYYAASGYVSYADNMVAEEKNNYETDYHLLTGNSSDAAFLRFYPKYVQDGNIWTLYHSDGWDVFCDALQNNDKGFFTGKTVKLGADIEVSRMAGASHKDFTGIFDGQGHTLTVSYGTSGSPINEDNAAPFRYVEGCVIRNLHVTGHIYTSKKNAAGIAGTQYEDVSINNCLSSVTIHSSINDGGNNDGTHGGFVGNHGGGTLNIVGCAFTGKMLTTAANKTTRCGGFVGWCNSATNIINCLYAPAAIENGETEVGITENCTFGRYNKATVSLTNCYYTRTLGTAQGKQPRSITVGDTYTTLSNISLSGSTTSYNVSGITAYANGGIKRGSTLYYGNGDQVSLTLSHSDHANGTFQGYAANNEAISGSGNPYSLTMPDADVTIRTIWSGSPDFLTRGDGDGSSANPYKITNANDLRDLAIYVNGTGIYSNGITETTAHDCSGKYFKQTFDITLSGEWEPIGANNHQFTGIYDGDNNKISGLTVNGSYMYAGLFGYTHYKNTSSYQCVLKNIIVENCDIDVSGVANSSAGGIVGYGGDDTEVKNCRVSGTIKATTSAGGIAGYMWTVTNGHVSKINQCFTDVTVAATKKGKLLGEGATTGIADAVLNSKNSYYHDDGSGVTAFGNCGDITYSVPVYTITGVPSGVTIDTEATVNNSGTNYYAAGNVTITVTDASKIFDTFTVSGATYSVDANKKSATVTLAASDATVSATLLSLTGSCGDNATWAVTDTNSDGTYETLTISGTGAITSSPWATDFAAGIKRVNISSADLTISDNPFSTLSNDVVIVVPTPAYAISYSSATYASKLRVALGSYLFTATNEGGAAAYEIANEADLRNLSAAVEATENISVSKTFRQTADISMTGGDFYPIGKRGDNYSFDGTYDGGGHTISGLTVSEDHGYIGLFGYIGCVANHHATVKNVVLVNPSVTATDSDNHAAHVGTVVGFCLQGTIVDNCMVINPTVNAYGTNKGTGAIVGALWYETNTMTNCYFYDSNAGHNYTAFPNNPIGSTVTRVARARKVTAGDGVTAVSPADASDPVNGFVYNNESYYREGLQLTLSSSLSAPDGYALGYSANGTAFDGSTYTVNSTDGDVTITAAYTANTYTVHFDGNGATDGSMDDQDFKYDKEQALTTCGFTRTHYDFAGWAKTSDGDVAYTDGQTVSNLTAEKDETVTLYAKWTLKTYSVNVTPAENMTLASGEASQSILDGDAMTDVTYTADAGYYFPTDYSVEDVNGIAVTRVDYTTITVTGTPMADATITLAAPTAITYTITYHPNDGEFTTDKNSYTVESADITLDEPTRTFYDFGGWYTNSSLSGPAVTSIDHGSMGNKEFWAKWTPITFTAGALSYEYTSGTDVKVTACDNSVTMVTIPATISYNDVSFSVTAIDADAFAGCTELTTIFMRAATPPTLGTDALDACTALTDIYVPVSNVDDYTAADNWSDYASIIKGYDGTCGDNVYWSYNSSGKTLTIFGTGAMDNYGSTNRPWQSLLGEITTVIIGDGVTIIGGRVFESCTNLTSVNISNDVTVIAGYAFAQCTSLKSVNMGSGVTTIGSGAFGLTGLESISLPASLTSIGPQAFARCPLASVSIPASVTSIGGQAFYYCLDLATVCMQATTPPTLGYAAFYNCNLTTIYVPNDKVGDYKAATNWSDYEGIITGFEYISLGDNADNSAKIEWWKNKVANVTLSGRTLWKDGDWNTLCLPFDVDLTDTKSPLYGATVKKLIASTSGVSGSTLTLNFEDETTTMTAGTPYIIKWTRANDYEDDDAHNLVNPVFPGVTISKTVNNVTSVDGKVTFVGSFSPVNFEANDQSILFLGAENKLYWPNANMTLGACRAHFELSDGAGVREFKLNFGEGETTAVANSQLSTLNSQLSEWYTIDGRKLDKQPTKKGLYIHNGNKVVIK